MGRYYNGDIDGKFWFAVQSSDDADFFGVSGYEPNYMEYEFEEDNLPAVEAGVAKCKQALGVDKKKLDAFFKKNNSYNDDMLVKAGFKKTEVKSLLMWYARLDLGEKILACMKKNGHCYFEAEL